MNSRVGDTAAPLVDIVAEGNLAAAGRPGVVGTVVVVVIVAVVVDRLIVAEQVRVAGNKKKTEAAAAAVVVIAVGSAVAAVEVVTGSENENENENEKVVVNVSAAAGVDGGAKNEANMKPSLRLEVGKKSSSRRPGQLGSGQRQTGQNMNKIGSDFGRCPGCGTS